jgi:hypothetical protein
MAEPSDLSGDYVVVTRQDRATGAWAWEIQRRSKPLGIRLHHNGFMSEVAAKLAGEKARKHLLDALVEEERNQSAD